MVREHNAKESVAPLGDRACSQQVAEGVRDAHHTALQLDKKLDAVVPLGRLTAPHIAAERCGKRDAAPSSLQLRMLQAREGGLGVSIKDRKRSVNDRRSLWGEVAPATNGFPHELFFRSATHGQSRASDTFLSSACRWCMPSDTEIKRLLNCKGKRLAPRPCPWASPHFQFPP